MMFDHLSTAQLARLVEDTKEKIWDHNHAIELATAKLATAQEVLAKREAAHKAWAVAELAKAMDTAGQPAEKVEA